MDYLICLIVLFSLVILTTFLIFTYDYRKKNVFPISWPVLGMIPGLFMNAHRRLDYVTDILTHSGGTFMLNGPWFANLDMLLTANPLDIHYILSKNFSNYPKGEKFRKLFDILGDGVFNSDGELWEIHRKVTMSVLKHDGFQSLLETIIWNKVETGFLPILESISRKGIETDLQDIFQRFTFDTISKLLLDHDPESLSLDFPYVACLKAFADAEEAVLHRHITPPIFWKLQQLLRVGYEKKMSDARRVVDQFIYKCINQKTNDFKNENQNKNKIKNRNIDTEFQEDKFLVLTALMREFKHQIGDIENPTKFLRDALINLMVAGKDSTSSTLSWFFYILAQNPAIVDKILEEIRAHLDFKSGKRWQAKDLAQMVYLHGAISESLRLFPPLPFNHKSPLQPDILPSGHRVDQDTKIILSIYSMGRMKSIWGEDCLEFKPERWVTERGRIKHEPSYKFPAFNAGPRTCVAKDVSFYEMKIVTITIIYHYRVELVEGHPVLPVDSMVLQMKHGLKVRLTKRVNGTSTS